jgi:hypothetical protein
MICSFNGGEYMHLRMKVTQTGTKANSLGFIEYLALRVRALNFLLCFYKKGALTLFYMLVY